MPVGSRNVNGLGGCAHVGGVDMDRHPNGGWPGQAVTRGPGIPRAACGHATPLRPRDHRPRLPGAACPLSAPPRDREPRDSEPRTANSRGRGPTRPARCSDSAVIHGVRPMHEVPRSGGPRGRAIRSETGLRSPAPPTPGTAQGRGRECYTPVREFAEAGPRPRTSSGLNARQPGTETARA